MIEKLISFLEKYLPESVLFLMIIVVFMVIFYFKIERRVERIKASQIDLLNTKADVYKSMIEVDDKKQSAYDKRIDLLESENDRLVDENKLLRKRMKKVMDSLPPAGLSIIGKYLDIESDE